MFFSEFLAFALVHTEFPTTFYAFCLFSALFLCVCFLLNLFPLYLPVNLYLFL
jgi:hypothetical protein